MIFSDSTRYQARKWGVSLCRSNDAGTKKFQPGRLLNTGGGGGEPNGEGWVRELKQNKEVFLKGFGVNK